MKQISDLIKKKKDEFKILPKKEVISLIAQQIKYSEDNLKNWKIIAKRISVASPRDATVIWLSIQKGTMADSTDKKGAFEMMCKRLPKIKKPKQLKLI